jgi:phospholipase/lecithinase/hemolysin
MALAAASLVGCGGGDPIGPKVAISSITVAGDSLSDVGTFMGMKFTVQNAADPAAGYPIWTQLVANSYGLDGSAQCAAYSGDPNTFAVALAANTTCDNYAVGGGRINTVNPSQVGSPYLVATQLADRAARDGYAANELLLVDGGGNDAADLVGAYLAAAQGDATALLAILGSLLDAETLAELQTQDPTMGLAAGVYMQALAGKLMTDINTHALSKGAKRVMVVNVPDITLTPRFQAVLAGVTQAQGAATATQLQAGIRGWITAFNTQLSTLAAKLPEVEVADFYADFTDQAANPAAYSLSDATQAVCPVTGQDSQGLPQYDFPTCADAALNALPGKSEGWWERYAFSDGFHPTPYGHQLLAASVSRALARAGWL